MYIVAGYCFLKIYLHYLFKLLAQNTKTEKINAYVKILLEAARIISIFIILLYADELIRIEMPSSILSGIVATIAIDSMLATIEKLPKRKQIPND